MGVLCVSIRVCGSHTPDRLLISVSKRAGVALRSPIGNQAMAGENCSLYLLLPATLVSCQCIGYDGFCTKCSASCMGWDWAVKTGKKEVGQTNHFVPSSVILMGKPTHDWDCLRFARVQKWCELGQQLPYLSPVFSNSELWRTSVVVWKEMVFFLRMVIKDLHPPTRAHQTRILSLAVTKRAIENRTIRLALLCVVFLIEEQFIIFSY